MPFSSMKWWVICKILFQNASMCYWEVLMFPTTIRRIDWSLKVEGVK